ncbi:MAG: hypothetical protein VX617_01745 [Pseudomonadota bacterium]|nr:hypothetical protein [Pseudomonadota bacterium]
MNSIMRQMPAWPYEEGNLIVKLPFSAQMANWGIRLVAKGLSCKVEIDTVYFKGFEKVNAMKAGGALYFFTETIFKSLSRDLIINCPCSPVLSGDEANLLTIISTSQSTSSQDIRDIFSEFLIPDALESAFTLAIDCGDAFLAAGLLLSVKNNSKTSDPTSLTKIIEGNILH